MCVRETRDHKFEYKNKIRREYNTSLKIMINCENMMPVNICKQNQYGVEFDIDKPWCNICVIFPLKTNGSGDKLVIRDNAKGEHPDSTDVMIFGMDTNGLSYSSVQAQGRQYSSICHPKNTEFL